VINEVLARNRSLTVGTQIVDFVEIYNPNGSSFNLGGMSLSVNSPQAGEWIFPTGTTIAANCYLLIKCDGATPAATNAARSTPANRSMAKAAAFICSTPTPTGEFHGIRRAGGQSLHRS
jgi:hypothetical protein